MFKIAEHSTGREEVKDLGVHAAFPIMREMVNGEARYHRIKTAERRQHIFHVVRDELNPILVRKCRMKVLDHSEGELERDKFSVR